MKKHDASLPGIRELIRQAEIEREAYLGTLIGEGLAAAWNAMARGATAIARRIRTKERLAPR